MKQRIQFPAATRVALFSGLLLIGSASAAAQNGNASKNPPADNAGAVPIAGGASNSNGKGPVAADDKGDNRKAQTDAKALVKGNDLAGAEQKLSASNASPANTASWHQETSQKLMQLAESFSRDGDSGHSAAVVTQTLQHLDSAATLAQGKGDAQGEGIARATAGFIHERYRGDIASAISSYQAAVKANPKDKAAQERLGQLQRADAVLRARSQQAKR